MDVREIIQTLGGPAAIARRLEIRSQAVSLWARANRIPLNRVCALERMARELGVHVRAEQMRPDVEWAVLREAT